ncbi:hypothetical protein F442_02125 [Phytophthora nicotianae P10297]|uniref:Chromo domain-containing protein n=5 Tax=Phytophthora nicotianae TaxID=4792 RepID=W2PDF4_PHYN3|nr:hypothetical protein PPTG_19405 [Phytophthora nicotianae INRA-310]ETI55131.1 hypothetical protein F443_02167 [Phytophthora nicotianae P1569]ETK94966.1 hypothetical protein L915_02068 [Phytophthora nicotianae]ETO83872.1 hypothetical protein F444_02175 [Phytophthora nicotianae P1976]ETP52934.1 hypothetical protein F442_02125 [Phytophthora nicotianae P10297]ETM01447.1 hypothetical protein L917_01975 [Phytophthora nicotianae]
MASSRGSHCAPDDDFDAALLLPEDSFEPAHEQGEHEVEAILDMQWKMRSKTSRRTREYLVKWKGYDETEWLPVTKLSCGALLYEFNQNIQARVRFRCKPENIVLALGARMIRILDDDIQEGDILYGLWRL